MIFVIFFGETTSTQADAGKVGDVRIRQATVRDGSPSGIPIEKVMKMIRDAVKP